MNKKTILLISLISYLFCSCIQDDVPNPEADILVFSFPENTLRTEGVEIYNDYLVAYPKENVNLRDSVFKIEVSQGATWERMESPEGGEVLFYIRVTSESREYSKLYSILSVKNIPFYFDLEHWIRPSNYYLYENPKEGMLQWYSSNNGAAVAWNSSLKPADEYLVRKITIDGSTVAELRTMVGPGVIAGGINYIPCLAGSLYLGGFNILTGLSDPLRSTLFGVPFNNGKPLRFSGEYMFKEGTDDYINSDGSKDSNKRDICSIYALIFKTDEDVKFLYGDNIANSPNIIARAEIASSDIMQSNMLIPFDLAFDYASYSIPFLWDELENNNYKIAIVFSSSKRGQYYEGRPGNTLVIDNIRIHYETRD